MIRTLSALALSAAAPLAAEAAAPDAGPSRPNIILIFSDDHALQAIGAYGSKINQTPAIDRLAREGMLFRNCYVGNSICGPSRATILTGKYSHLHRFVRNGNQFDGSQPTLPKYLQAAGYQTALIGKWHLVSDPTGFDHWDILIGQGPYYNPPMIRNGVRHEHTGYTTHIITDKTLHWLQQERDPSRPFFLMYQHKAPHRDWAPHPDYFHLYEDQDIPEPETLFDDYWDRGLPARTQDMTIAHSLTRKDLKLIPPDNLTPEQLAAWNAFYEPRNAAFRAANLKACDLVRWKYQRYIKDYLRVVAAMDDQIARVLDYLDQSGLSQNTIVVYSSDQGFFLGEHGWFDKRWIYQESVKTPLIIRWPGVAKPGSVNTDIVSILDLPETFLDAAGVPIPQDMQGRSLRPVLAGQTPLDWRQSWYYHYYEYPGSHNVRRHYGVVTKDFTLAHFYEPEVNSWEMYDHARDPQQIRNVADLPEYAAQRKVLEEEIKRLRRELLVPDEDPPESLPLHQRKAAGLQTIAPPKD